MPKIHKRFRVGSRVVLSPDALENYGDSFIHRVLVVSHVSTKHMPSAEFFAKGKPAGYHPGFDESGNSALYDFKDSGALPKLNASLYDWELEPAPKKWR